MQPRNRVHLILRARASAEPYTRPPGGGGGAQIPAPTDRQSHIQHLRDQLEEVEATAASSRTDRPYAVDGAIDGVYLGFDSFPGIHLALESLDPRAGRQHPELISVQEVATASGVVEHATVFVPDGTMGYFISRLQEYAETAAQDNPRHRNLIDRIHQISLATIETLWTDPPGEFPEPTTVVWWEVWLRRRDGEELTRFRHFASQADIQVSGQTLGFGERVVVLAHATAEQLAGALDVLDDLAELRRAHELTPIIALEPAAEQADWVTQLATRTRPADTDAPTVCVLDTGVHRTHPLLAGSLSESDSHASDASWGIHDHDGHGTEMAGLALYGPFGDELLSNREIRLRHRLESVKLRPPPPRFNPPELYAAVTATATSRVEIAAPERRRVFSLAMTASDSTGPDGASAIMIGQPTSWSASIDALAAGRSVATTSEGLVFVEAPDNDGRRLFLVSAGNVDSSRFETDHLQRSDLEAVQDPAQAWNALTVGAYTRKDSLATARRDWNGWTPVASRGELSPHSRTSVAYHSAWPVKPDVVFEGGNIARSPDGTSFDTPEELQLLTTRLR